MVRVTETAMSTRRKPDQRRCGSIPGTDTNPQTAPSYQIGDDERSDYNRTQSYEERLFNETNSESEKALGKLVSNQSTMSIVLWYGKVVETADGLTLNIWKRCGIWPPMRPVFLPKHHRKHTEAGSRTNAGCYAR